MAGRVTWSPQALVDIEAIAAFIEQDSPFYARAVVARIVAAVRQVEQFPMAGRVVPEMQDPSIRELFVFSYRVIYRVEDEVATVLAVVHGKRLLETGN